jgi:hypothetical protein
VFEDISASGWLVILCALGLGFGLVRFLIVTKRDESKPDPPRGPDDQR